MQRVDHVTASPALPAPSAPGTPGYFTGGDPLTATPPTTVPPDWLNGLQEELVNVILAAGLTLDKTNNAQLLAAIIAITSPGGGGGIVPASAAEILAGNINNKVLTPKNLRDAMPRDYTAGWRQEADGWLEQWGQSVAVSGGTSTTTASITFPISFPVECIDVYAVPLNPPQPSLWNPLTVLRTAVSQTGATFLFDTTDAAKPFTQNVNFRFFAKGR